MSAIQKYSSLHNACFPDRLVGPAVGIIAALKARHPDIPVIPVYLDGLYRTLPKGRTLIVPFGGTLVMGDPLSFSTETSIDAITEKARLAIEAMAQDLLDENKIPSSDSP